MVDATCPVCGITYIDDTCRASSDPRTFRGGILVPLSQEEMNDRCQDRVRDLGECEHWRAADRGASDVG